ncbi:hypothetical protein Ciccas_005561 [Cichlidogyrus casuarinus]|uniref:G-protein coupled receptors family 1 profile domain-containing protein n=1 Tax=Cichlidogyrus casuarinus TaxID=1844966 RepID=A0ABD2Q999_9PLAT
MKVIVALLYPIALMCQTSGIWVTVCLTAERYIAICYPFKASILSSISKARVTVISCVIASFIYNAPRYSDFQQFLQQPLAGDNSTAENPNSWQSLFKKIYFTYFYATFMWILPLISICGMNIMLIRTLRQARKNMSRLNAQICQNNSRLCVNSANLSHSDRVNIQRSSCIVRADKNMTRMVIFVVAAFLICQSPAMVFNAAYGLYREQLLKISFFRYLTDVRNFLITFNSCVNFAIYCLMGAKFRRTFLHVILPWVERRKYNSSRQGTLKYYIQTPRSRAEDNSQMQRLKDCSNEKHSSRQFCIMPLRRNIPVNNNMIHITRVYPDTV